MNLKWDTSSKSKNFVNTAHLTDSIIEKTSSLESSFFNENLTPKFENINDKNSPEGTIFQLRSQLFALTQSHISLNEAYSQLKKLYEDKE